MRRPRKQRRRAKIIIPVASMADIAFQLIIFFMICSSFAREAGIPLRPPTTPNIERLRESNSAVAIDTQGQIYVQGRRVPDALSVETELAALLRNARTAEARTKWTAGSRNAFGPTSGAAFGRFVRLNTRCYNWRCFRHEQDGTDERQPVSAGAGLYIQFR